MATKFINGYLDGVENSGNRTTYKVKRDEGRKFPDWFIGYFENDDDDESAPNLKAKRWYAFEVREVERNGKTYYNYVSATPTSAAEAAEQPNPPAKSGNTPSAAPAASQRTDPQRESIEKQVAFKGAVDLMKIRMERGDDVNSYHVLQLADYFAMWMRGEVKVKPIWEKETKEQAEGGHLEAAARDAGAVDAEEWPEEEA